ncbi:hypothetical protein L596_017135 [Steinernema carpocapsae]|uniref:Palmitoyltransferase n=2 Tax=Steinernema carpocapsae TaxID=34508 RepID=A0A4U5N1I5_STECR|nr:hypothetical protein L596_017135 [Steinernema carpocapsae]
MSWYSRIYVFVRQYREKHPFLGFFLHISLYALLAFQFVGAIFSIYVYNWVFLRIFVRNAIQRTIYGVVYNYLMFMFFWSIGQTIITKVARVPKQYYVTPEVDKQMKEATPFLKGRYEPDASSQEKAHEQYNLLVEAAESARLRFVEVDSWMRLRYCYMCSLIKPDRAHHCMSCGFCVVKYDHHCPWINKCVSHRNYKYFLLYLIYGMIIAVISVLTSLEAPVRFVLDQNWAEDWPHLLQVLVCLLMHCAFGYYPLFELLVYHLKLIKDNETTCEQAKPANIKGDNHANYNLGTYRNYRAVFGWGLWAIPVDTRVNDGRHFPVNYPSDSQAERYVVRRAAEVPFNSVKMI